MHSRATLFFLLLGAVCTLAQSSCRRLDGVAYDGEQYLVVGSNKCGTDRPTPLALVSRDLKSWTTVTLPMSVFGNVTEFKTATYLQGHFVVSYVSTEGAEVATTQDAKNWQKHALPLDNTFYVNRVSYFNNTWMLMASTTTGTRGRFLVSNDFASWKVVQPSTSDRAFYYGVTYAEDKDVALVASNGAANGPMMFSFDVTSPSTWSNSQGLHISISPRDVAYGDFFIAVGLRPRTSTATDGYGLVIASHDAVHYSVVYENNQLGSVFNAIDHLNNVWLAVGKSVIRSGEGISWEAAAQPRALKADETLNAVHVGQFGCVITGTPNLVWVSSDATCNKFLEQNPQ